MGKKGRGKNNKQENKQTNKQKEAGEVEEPTNEQLPEAQAVGETLKSETTQTVQAEKSQDVINNQNNLLERSNQQGEEQGEDNANQVNQVSGKDQSCQKPQVDNQSKDVTDQVVQNNQTVVKQEEIMNIIPSQSLKQQQLKQEKVENLVQQDFRVPNQTKTQLSHPQQQQHQIDANQPQNAQIGQAQKPNPISEQQQTYIFQSPNSQQPTVQINQSLQPEILQDIQEKAPQVQKTENVIFQGINLDNQNQEKTVTEERKAPKLKPWETKKKQQQSQPWNQASSEIDSQAVKIESNINSSDGAVQFSQPVELQQSIVIGTVHKDEPQQIYSVQKTLQNSVFSKIDEIVDTGVKFSEQERLRLQREEQQKTIRQQQERQQRERQQKEYKEKQLERQRQIEKQRHEERVQKLKEQQKEVMEKAQQKLKAKNQIDQENSIWKKFGLSVAAAALLSGAVWFGTKDKKWAAVSTLVTFAGTFIIQK